MRNTTLVFFFSISDKLKQIRKLYCNLVENGDTFLSVILINPNLLIA